MNELLQVSLEQGLIFAILAMGVSITYKILDFADLSADGTFPLGAFLFAKFVTSRNGSRIKHYLSVFSRLFSWSYYICITY